MSATILIAEDQPNFRIGLHSIIEQQLPECTIIGETDNGEEAWNQISTYRPEIALLDIRMPGMSGIEVAEQIHSHRLDTLFVMITGYQEFHYAQSAVRYGAFDFILKPCSEEEIVAMLNKVYLKVQEKQLIHEQLMIAGRVHQEPVIRCDAVVDKITRFIDENFMNDCSVSAIAAHVYLNPTYLSTMFKKKTGTSLSAYLTKVRLEQAMSLLVSTDMKISEVSEATGFGESAYFANVLKRRLVYPQRITEISAPTKLLNEKKGRDHGMRMVFRWFGTGNDTVTPQQIKQIPGVGGLVWSLHDMPAGREYDRALGIMYLWGVWDSLARLQSGKGKSV